MRCLFPAIARGIRTGTVSALGCGMRSILYTLAILLTLAAPAAAQNSCFGIASVFSGHGAAKSACYGVPDIEKSELGYIIRYDKSSSGAILNIETDCASCVLVVTCVPLENRTGDRLRAAVLPRVL